MTFNVNRGTGALGGQAAEVGNDNDANKFWSDNIHWIVLIAVVSAISGCCLTLCLVYFVLLNAASKPPVETTHAKTVEMQSENDPENPKDARPETEGDSTQDVPEVVYSE